MCSSSDVVALARVWDITNPDETFFNYIAIIVDALSFVVSVGDFSEFARFIPTIYRRNLSGEMASLRNPSPFFTWIVARSDKSG